MPAPQRAAPWLLALVVLAASCGPLPETADTPATTTATSRPTTTGDQPETQTPAASTSGTTTPAASATSSTAETTTTTAATTTTTIPDNPGDAVNCADFDTWADAQRWYDAYSPHYGDIALIDINNNGVACEALLPEDVTVEQVAATVTTMLLAAPTSTVASTEATTTTRRTTTTHRTTTTVRPRMSDSAVKKAIIAQSITSYSGRCACPYNTASNGSRCGGRSAYSKPGGASPLCYPSDVTQAMVERYRRNHP